MLWPQLADLATLLFHYITNIPITLTFPETHPVYLDAPNHCLFSLLVWNSLIPFGLLKSYCNSRFNSNTMSSMNSSLISLSELINSVYQYYDVQCVWYFTSLVLLLITYMLVSATNYKLHEVMEQACSITVFSFYISLVMSFLDFQVVAASGFLEALVIFLCPTGKQAETLPSFAFWIIHDARELCSSCTIPMCWIKT